jgi:integral membrane sensor domain MASE1
MKPDLLFCSRLLGVTVLYVAAAKVGLMYAIVGSTVTLLWAPSGIALAALLAYGWRMAFAIALGAFLANAGTGIPFFAAGGIALGNTLEALVGASLMVRLARVQSSLDTRRGVFALIAFAAFFSTTLSASIGICSLPLPGGSPSSRAITARPASGVGVMEVDVFGHEAGRAQVSAPALHRFADEVVGHA